MQYSILPTLIGTSFIVQDDTKELKDAIYDIIKNCNIIYELVDSSYKEQSPDMYEKMYLSFSEIINLNLLDTIDKECWIGLENYGNGKHNNLINILKTIHFLIEKYIEKDYKNDNIEVYLEKMVKLADNIYSGGDLLNDSEFNFKYKLYCYLDNKERNKIKEFIGVNSNKIALLRQGSKGIRNVLSEEDLNNFLNKDKEKIIDFLLNKLTERNNTLISSAFIVVNNPNLPSMDYLFASEMEYYNFGKYIEWKKIKELKYQKVISEQ